MLERIYRVDKFVEMNFNPQATLARLGVRAEIANYKRLEA